jgi:predicted tellurium resistance membrane protein TerC
MAAFSGKVSKFVEDNPTFKMLALAFLVLVGVMLVAEGIGSHVGKGYLYAAMAFSFVGRALEHAHAQKGRKRARSGRLARSGPRS